MNEQIKQRIAQLNNGEVPSGYEKTEFGVFPCDWAKDKTFGDLFDFYGGLGKSRDELGDEGHAYLHYGDLHRGAFNVVSHEQYEQLPKYDVALKGTETYLMEDGDVAFLDASEDLEGTSRAVLIDNPDNEPFIAGLHIIYGKSKDESLDKWYKQYITLPESVRKQFQRLSVGFKVYGVNRETLPKIQLAYPKSTEEQSKIAEILMKWDEAIELQEQYIKSLKRQKIGVMNTLFDFSNECILPFKDAVKPYKYQKELQTSQYQETGSIPIVDQGKNKIVGYTDDEDYVIYPPEKGLLLFGDHTTEVKYINHDFAVGGDGVKLFEENELCQLKYVYYYLLAFPFLIEGYKRHYSILRNKPIKFPMVGGKIDEKKMSEIVSILSQIDETIDLQIQKTEKIKKQRKTLQQYLLNGIVRV